MLLGRKVRKPPKPGGRVKADGNQLKLFSFRTVSSGKNIRCQKVNLFRSPGGSTATPGSSRSPQKMQLRHWETSLLPKKLNCQVSKAVKHLKQVRRYSVTSNSTEDTQTFVRSTFTLTVYWRRLDMIFFTLNTFPNELID